MKIIVTRKQFKMLLANAHWLNTGVGLMFASNLYSQVLNNAASIGTLGSSKVVALDGPKPVNNNKRKTGYNE